MSGHGINLRGFFCVCVLLLMLVVVLLGCFFWGGRGPGDKAKQVVLNVKLYFKIVFVELYPAMCLLSVTHDHCHSNVS